MKKVVTIIIVLITLIILLGISIIFQDNSTPPEKKYSNNINIVKSFITLRQYTLEEVIELSEYIVIGKCIDKNESQYCKTINPATNEAVNSISTDFKIQIDSILKGDINDEYIFVRTDIGRVDNIEYQCNEQINFNIGEKVLLFINKDDFEKEYNCYRASALIYSKYCLENGEYYNSYLNNSIQINELILLLDK